MKKPVFLTALAALLATPIAIPAALHAAGPAVGEWAIGPIIRGRNYSVNMPLTMSEGRAGPTFTFPGPTRADGHVHYVTAPVQSLEGARRITLRYRIDAAPGVRFVQQETQAPTGTLSLYFQRRGDRWSARTPRHRWYSPAGRDVPLRPGTHTVSISLDEPWIAIMGGNNRDFPSEFRAALAEAHQVGFTFGGDSGRGHGVYATGPACFTVLDFRIE